MASGESIPLSTEQFNRIMVRMTEFFDRVIRKKMRQTSSIYRNIQPIGPFKLGEGYVRKVHTFYQGLDDQAGLTKWEPETTFRAPGTNGQDDPGYDPCTYKAHMLGYGFKTEQYSGYRTSRRSPNYCINDFIYDWEFEQQLGLILNSFGDVGMQVWDNYGREMYMNFSQKFIATDSLVPIRYTYDPFSSIQMTVPKDTVISTLTMRHIDSIWQQLALQVPEGALAQDSGMPMFGMAIHPYDWDDVIKREPAIREDFRYARPDLLVDGVGKFSRFRGFAMTFDLQAPRAKVIGKDADGNLLLERVVPFKEEAITQGTRWEVDPDYLNAEYTIINFIIKNVFEKQVPPVAPGKFGKAAFGTTPSNMGELQWINIPDVETNVLGEKGFFFSRFKAFAKPLENDEYAISLLVKRCPHTTQVLCEPCEDATSGAKTVTDAVAVDEDGDGSYFQVEVTISDANGLLCEGTQSVTVTFADASTETAVIADDTGAPSKYVITFPTEADWVANGGGISTIECA